MALKFRFHSPIIIPSMSSDEFCSKYKDHLLIWRTIGYYDNQVDSITKLFISSITSLATPICPIDSRYFKAHEITVTGIIRANCTYYCQYAESTEGWVSLGKIMTYGNGIIPKWF